MRITFVALTLLLTVSCKSTSARSHASPSSFVIPSFDEEDGAGELEDSSAMLRQGNDCSADASTIRCVHFVKNDDAKSIVIELPPTHPQAGKKVTILLAGIEALELKAPEICERTAAQKVKQRVTKALLTAHRIDIMKLVRVKPQTLQAEVQVDGQSLAVLLQDEKLVRAAGSSGKADWCERPTLK